MNIKLGSIKDTKKEFELFLKSDIGIIFWYDNSVIVCHPALTEGDSFKYINKSINTIYDIWTDKGILFKDIKTFIVHNKNIDSKIKDNNIDYTKKYLEKKFIKYNIIDGSDKTIFDPKTMIC